MIYVRKTEYGTEQSETLFVRALKQGSVADPEGTKLLAIEAGYVGEGGRTESFLIGLSEVECLAVIEGLQSLRSEGAQ